MYYITPRNSETGKKFQEIVNRRDKSFEAQKELADKYGFNRWRSDSLFGGISGVFFPDNTNVDIKIWRKKGGDEYYPRASSKTGKLILKEIEALPKIRNTELNACIGFDEWFCTIGFAWNNDQYFGFVVGENWDVKIPDDCEEVLHSKYLELFGKKNEQSS